MEIRTTTPYRNNTPDIAIITGDGIGEQWLQYQGKSYHVDDVLAVMKAAEADTSVMPKRFTVALIGASYRILELMNNGTYCHYSDFGEYRARAVAVANMLNEKGFSSDS